MFLFCTLEKKIGFWLIYLNYKFCVSADIIALYKMLVILVLRLIKMAFISFCISFSTSSSRVGNCAAIKMVADNCRHQFDSVASCQVRSRKLNQANIIAYVCRISLSVLPFRIVKILLLCYLLHYCVKYELKKHEF